MVILEDDSIAEVGSFNGEKDVVDLGDAVVLPGWVNCHTHLEFSHLSQPLGEKGTPITDWIPEVIGDRFGRDPEVSSPVLKGLDACHRTGTALVGEIATSSDELELYANSPLLGSIFFERLGNDAGRVNELMKRTNDWLAKQEAANWFCGLSPHAPYSVSPELLEQLLGAAGRGKAPVAMHIAESQEELEWLNHRRGPFKELLENLGALPNLPPGWNMDQVINQLCSGDRSILVHGNYLSGKQLDVIAESDTRIVFCPRTHAFFEHDEYPLRAIRDRRIKLGIGTDSLASNPDLNMLGEIQLVRSRFADLSPSILIEMATIDGAKILCREKEFGSIEPGKSSKLIHFQLNGESSPLDAIVDGKATFGGWLHDNDEC